MRIRNFKAPAILVIATVTIGISLAVWKSSSLASAAEAAANQPEPVESVSSALAEERDHLRSTTSIGTVVARLSAQLLGRDVA